MAKIQIQTFLGEMYRDVDVTNSKQIGYYIQVHVERHGKAPDIILIDPAIDPKTVAIPELYKDTVAVLVKQYCQKGHIHVAHYIYITKEV